MKNKLPWTLQKERLIVTLGIVASVLAGLVLNTLSKDTHNIILTWLGTAAFCVAIVLAIIVLPMVMRKAQAKNLPENGE